LQTCLGHFISIKSNFAVGLLEAYKEVLRVW
jgi:hypothetical protein